MIHGTEENWHSSRGRVLWFEHVSSPKSVISNKQKSNRLTTFCWTPTKIPSGYVDLKRKKKKKKKRWKACKTYFKAAAQSNWSCHGLSQELYHTVPSSISPLFGNSSLTQRWWVASHLHLKSFLEIKCNLLQQLDLSTQTSLADYSNILFWQGEREHLQYTRYWVKNWTQNPRDIKVTGVS